MLSLLWPIQLALLTFLHVAFAVSRLVFLLRQLPAATRRWIHLQLSADPPYLSNDVEHDRIRWKKTPTHLAVVFVPGTSLSTWNSRWLGGPQAEQRELGKLVKDVKALLGWCEELGMASLSVYDERGVLDRNAEAVMTALSCPSFLSVSKEPHQSSGRTTFRVPLLNPRGRDGVEVPGREVDSGCGASEVESCDTGTTSTASSTLVLSSIAADQPWCRSHLTLNLLSRLSGRPHLAKVAQELAVDVHDGKVELKELSEGLITETIEASGITEPDLLVVLGGPYLRLRGFPPWHLRLTEMYHHSSPTWLPAPPISYSILRRALDVYGGAEMRLGR